VKGEKAMKIFRIVILIAAALVLIAAIPVGKNNQVSDFQLEIQQDAYKSKGPAICWNPVLQKWVPCGGKQGKYKYPGSGEPRMEKVSYFPYISGGSVWDTSCKNGGSWSNGSYTIYYCIRTYKLPVGCNFRYQY